MVQASAALLRRALLETDERSKLEGELVSGIEVIKCSAWEVRGFGVLGGAVLGLGLGVLHDAYRSQQSRTGAGPSRAELVSTG